MDITREFLNEKHPDLVTAIQDEAMKKGIAQGAQQERERIQAVADQLIPGHENLIAALKFDGQTTGEQAAVKVLQAEKEIRATARKDFQADAPEPLPPTTEPETPTAKTPQEKWDSDPELRAEFTSFDTWQAYETAMTNGLVKTR